MLTPPPLVPIVDFSEVARIEDLRSRAALSRTWSRWFTLLRVALNQKAGAFGSVTVTDQRSAIATTTIQTPTLSAGVYRMSYSLRVTTVADVSSSVQITIGWTSTGVAQTYTGALVNGNTTTSSDAHALVVHADAGTTLTYATAYASNAANVMAYRVDLRVEALP